MDYKELTKLILESAVDPACDFVPTENRFTQDETGEEVAKLAAAILNLQEPPDPPYEQSQDSKKEFKREWKIYGAPMQRGTFTAELAKQLRAAGIEAYSSADAALYQQCHPKKKLPGSVRDKGKGIIVLYEMEDGTKERWYFAYKPSKQAKSGYATKYEGNLIYAINIVGGQSEAKAKELAGSRNEDAADQISADDVIAAIKWGGKPTKAQRASGGTLDDVKLTDLYLKHKVKSTEPKTDIFVWLGKDRKNVSVKAATGAQYASAQGPEAVAIFEAAFKDIKGKGAASKKDYYKTVESILTKFGGRATGEGVATFEPMREQYAKETGQAATALQGDVSDTILGDCTGAECKQKLTQLTALAKNPQAIAKVEENQKKKLAEMNDAAKKEALVNMQGALNEAVPKIAQATQDWMKSPEARKLILREAVTGENKFVTKEAIADAVLKWDDTDFSKSSWALLDDKWFSDHVGETKYDFRSRGGSGLANRGIAFRLDALTENKTPSALLSSTENQELRLLWEAMVLTEGPWSDVLAKTKQKAQQFISTTTDKLKQLGAEGQKIYNAIKAVAAKAWKNIKEYAIKLYESGVQFVKDSVKKVQDKIMAVVQDFGTMFPTLFDVNSAVIEVGEGSAAAAPELVVQENKLNFKDLVLLVEQQLSEAEPPNQCDDPAFEYPAGGACTWAWKATTKKPDGVRIVEKAMKILETNKSTAKGYAEFLATEPKEKWEHVKSQGKAKREYKIFGAPYQRKEVSKALMEKIKACNVEAYCWANAEEYEKCYKSPLPSSITGYGRGVRVMFAMEEKVGRSWERMDKKEFWDFLYKPSPAATSGHSTKFEGNLVVAINTSGVKDAQKIEAAQKKAGANLDPADQDVAKNIIDEIFPGESKPSDARKALTKYKQTKAYTDEGLGEKGTAKTDIIITFDGQKNVSVKKFGGAQYASAQGPEAVAIYKVAFENTNTSAKKNFHEQAKIILKKFGSRATGDGTAAYEPVRKAYNELKQGKRADELSVDVTKLFTGDCVEKKGRRKDHSKCKEIYDRLVKIDPATNTDMRDKILANWENSYKLKDKEARAQAKAGVEAALDASMPELEQIPLNFLESADAKKLILKEAVTGEGKFKAGSDGIANSMLKWDDDDPKNSSWALLDETWFSKHVNLTSYEYRKRGGSDGSDRGMGFRLDDLIKESQGKKPQASNLLTEQLEKISNVSWVPLLLTEGVWTEGLLANIGKGVSDSVDAFKQTIATMGAAGKEILSKVEAMAKKTWQYLTDWVKKLYEDGIEWVKTTVSEVQQKLLSIFTDFGKAFKTFFDVESASVVVGEGSDTEAPDMEIKNEHLTSTPLSYTMLREMVENLMGEE